MLARITALPFFVILMGISAISMMVPALHAQLALDDAFTARIFLYGTIIFGVLSFIIGIATQGYKPKDVARSQLISLLAAFAALPIIFAIPFYEAALGTTYLDAWFEMVSSFTTTGASLYQEAGQINASLHLWRGLVGWMGGLLVWVTAVAILAPMNIGGFEVRARGKAGEARHRHTRTAHDADSAEQLARYGATLAPIYVGLTAILFVGLSVAGEVPIVAAIHAMSVMATSGISPIHGLQFAASGLVGEILIFVFLLLALSRLTFSRGLFSDDSDSIFKDAEVRLGLALVLIVTSLLFVRHYAGSIDEEKIITDNWEGLRAFWGALFTVMSFLTTTGFESYEWVGARDWSDLKTPGLILVGMALIGGGVATTAGGIKLLRVYALIKHGERELNRLVRPNSVGGGGAEARRIRRQGAYISWVFFMLVALSMTVVMLLLSLTGLSFEKAMVLSVSALTTTGPLAEVAAENAIAYSEVSDSAKVILAGAMVLGRLETLALISLFNPEFWRR